MSLRALRRPLSFPTLATILAMVGLSACVAAPRSPSQEASPMTVSAAPPSTTADAVGRKFLAMIASLKSPDDLSEEVVERAMGVTLEPAPVGPFASQPLTGEWVYLAYFVPESLRRNRLRNHWKWTAASKRSTSRRRHLMSPAAARLLWARAAFSALHHNVSFCHELAFSTQRLGKSPEMGKGALIVTVRTSN